MGVTMTETQRQEYVIVNNCKMRKAEYESGRLESEGYMTNDGRDCDIGKTMEMRLIIENK